MVGGFDDRGFMPGSGSGVYPTPRAFVGPAAIHAARPNPDEGRTKPGARALGYLGSFQVTRRRRNSSGVSQSLISNSQDDGSTVQARTQNNHRLFPSVTTLKPTLQPTRATG